MSIRDGVCPHCARRRTLKEIHKTAAGFVARFDYEPCQCPAAQRVAARQAARVELAKFGLACCGLTFIAGVPMESTALLIVGGGGVLVCVALWLWNRPAKR